MRRILLIHCPSVRRTPGSSFGPMKISATTPIRRSSLQLKSNMEMPTPRATATSVQGSHPTSGPKAPARAADPFALRRGRAAPLPSGGRAGLGAPLEVGRGRGLMVEGLGIHNRIGLDGVLVLHALLEGLDALREVTHQFRNLPTAAEQQQKQDHDHDP